MRDAAALEAPNRKPSFKLAAIIRASLPTFAESSLAAGSALLLVLSFPDFNLWWLAWIGLIPLMVVVARGPNAGRAFVLGWLWGTIFFYGTCWWLTYPMIHYGHVNSWFAYPLFLLPVILVALFPAMACAGIARVMSRFGSAGLFAAPLIWISFEWLRYEVTGQLWNALGYSQAFHPFLIQAARWGGVYAVGFLMVLTNATITCAVLRRTLRMSIVSVTLLLGCVAFIAFSGLRQMLDESSRVLRKPDLIVIAVQPAVPMDSFDDSGESQLLARHISSGSGAIQIWERSGAVDNLKGMIVDSDWAKDDSRERRSVMPRLVIWPESPMNFSYSRDPKLRETVAAVARTNHASLLLNSLEPARDGGEHNSALMVNEEGRIVAQYDKIRLMPFGEYVPLPRWIPGASSVRGIVGEFTPGSSYTLMPLGAFRVGVFICIEAAHPGIARSFTNAGADVLINISNDGYLGPTPVMQQHLANAVFRAVENDRDIVRVTNSGISAYIDSHGRIVDSTPSFQTTARSWYVSKRTETKTFYTRHGDLFVYACALISLGIVSASLMTKRSEPGAVATG